MDTTVDDSCLSAFQELQSKREINMVSYRLAEDGGTVVVEDEGNLTHEEMLASLPADEPRFVVYNLLHAAADGSRRNDIVMIFWIPDMAPPALRLAYADAYGTLRDLLEGVQVHVRATTLAQLEYQELVSQA